MHCTLYSSRDFWAVRSGFFSLRFPPLRPTPSCTGYLCIGWYRTDIGCIGQLGVPKPAAALIFVQHGQPCRAASLKASQLGVECSMADFNYTLFITLYPCLIHFLSLNYFCISTELSWPCEFLCELTLWALLCVTVTPIWCTMISSRWAIVIQNAKHTNRIKPGRTLYNGLGHSVLGANAPADQSRKLSR